MKPRINYYRTVFGYTKTVEFNRYFKLAGNTSKFGFDMPMCFLMGNEL
jgi:hypothetical protein